MGGDWYAPHLVYGLRIDFATANALLCERNRRAGTWKGSEDLAEDSFVDSDGEPYDYSEDVVEEDGTDEYCRALKKIARSICPDLPRSCRVFAVTYDICTRSPCFADLMPDFVFGEEIECGSSPLCIADITKMESRLCEGITRLKKLLPAAAPLHDVGRFEFVIGTHMCMLH
ncbi:hypothetical protein QKT49_gp076 [Acanthamoeba castellanii medusavirus]|uniref:Uncharacterized protein n=1 Tax=Acanthamoeba castellanii medusavirus J1 TaxID=3114988 RepID=A0A3T1CWK8_9VIRU|nr:hypothetical protein QKT49_gp076 [Acanthamoeba castellanii medusavirus]BBI30216.1 hypothetical protein [Acanthamoeba castellanii medusavirus J1]